MFISSKVIDLNIFTAQYQRLDRHLLIISIMLTYFRAKIDWLVHCDESSEHKRVLQTHVGLQLSL